MSRYYWDKKTEADYLHKIQTWWLKKHGYLEPGTYGYGGITWTSGFSGNQSSVGFETSTIYLDEKIPSIRFIYTNTNRQTGEQEELNYLVRLESTPCHFGGVRWWFICPLVINGSPCNRRVGTLYMGSKYFGCRHCYKLSYESRNKNRRYHMHPFFDYGLDMVKIEKLEASMKRWQYAGRPTKKAQKLNRMLWRQIEQAPLVKKLME